VKDRFSNRAPAGGKSEEKAKDDLRKKAFNEFAPR